MARKYSGVKKWSMVYVGAKGLDLWRIYYGDRCVGVVKWRERIPFTVSIRTV